MAKPKPKNELEALQSEWYEKLAEEGFEDAEDEKGRLKTWSNVFSRNYNETSAETKTEYYRLAEHFLETHEFQDDRERFMWGLHSTGKSIRHITKEVNKRPPWTAHRNETYRTLKALAKKMVGK